MDKLQRKDKTMYTGIQFEPIRTQEARRRKQESAKYWRTMALVMWAVWVVTLIGIAAAVTLL